MTCCEEDINFLPVICRYNSNVLPLADKYISLTGIVIVTYLEKFDSYMPVIKVNTFEEVPAPVDELLYFI